MAFCTKCGSNIPDGENFCPNCFVSQVRIYCSRSVT